MFRKVVIVVIVLLSTAWARPVTGVEVTLDAAQDVWLRESQPDAPAFESDLVSVWSSSNTGAADAGSRRFGLMQWDLGSLSGQILTSATLRLWVDDTFSGINFPLKQVTFVVDSSGTPLGELTWNTFISEKDSGKQPLETLGLFDRGAPVDEGTAGTYISDTGASAADLALIQTSIDSNDGLLTLLFVAVEDGEEYRGDWGDGTNVGGPGYVENPGQLILSTSQPACQLADALPDAVLGQDYAASAAELSGCSEDVFVQAAMCMPRIPGLTFSSDGMLTGTARMAGLYRFEVELFDPQSSTAVESRTMMVRVQSSYNAHADQDHDGDVDLEDLDAFALDFTGSAPAPCSLTGAPEGKMVLEAASDIWIRESAPDSAYESDLVSVWSSLSDDGGVYGRRYGLVEFDLGPLQGEAIAGAWLEMWVADTYSGTEYPVKQRAFVVTPGATALPLLTWNTYQSEVDAGKTALEGLGAFDAPIPTQSGTAGTYLTSNAATAADLEVLSGFTDTLSLVFIADEDGNHYRGDWGDGTNPAGAGFTEHPARLVVITGSPCYAVTGAVPQAVVGNDYFAELVASETCTGPLTWQVVGCALPPGLTLDTSTGAISGIPQMAGDYDVRLSVADSSGGPPSAFDLTVKVEGASKGDLDGDGDVDRDDLVAFQDAFTGPGDPTLDFCWRDYVLTALDTLLEHGTDQYGPVHTAMLTAILDLDTLTVPEMPPLLDANIRTEDRPDHGRRSPAGSNLWLDNQLIRVLYRATDVTGDTRYAQAADDYIADYAQHAVDPAKGFFVWGSHVYYNIFTDQADGDGGGSGPHEILIRHPEWSEFFRVNPAATQTEIDAIWTWHVHDKVNGRHNRHGDGNPGLDFAFSGGSFILAFASAYVETGQQHYLDKARLVDNWHWSHRDPVTGLLMDAPSAGSRYDALHSFTSVVGPFASQLLRTYEITGDPVFRDHAIAYIKAYDQYGWDPDLEQYYGMIALDGTTVPQQPPGAGYDVYKPTGHVDVWRTTMYSYEFPIAAAQSALYAYELSGTDASDRDPELLDIALRWARTLEQALPAQPGRRWEDALESVFPGVFAGGGTYAENYGRMISFFVNLYHVTGETKHLVYARALAREAVSKLYYNGLFRGHPFKNYYQSNDGVGYLLHAFMQLDALPGKWKLAF